MCWHNGRHTSRAAEALRTRGARRWDVAGGRRARRRPVRAVRAIRGSMRSRGRRNRGGPRDKRSKISAASAGILLANVDADAAHCRCGTCEEGRGRTDRQARRGVRGGQARVGVRLRGLLAPCVKDSKRLATLRVGRSYHTSSRRRRAGLPTLVLPSCTTHASSPRARCLQRGATAASWQGVLRPLLPINERHTAHRGNIIYLHALRLRQTGPAAARARRRRRRRRGRRRHPPRRRRRRHPPMRQSRLRCPPTSAASMPAGMRWDAEQLRRYHRADRDGKETNLGLGLNGDNIVTSVRESSAAARAGVKLGGVILGWWAARSARRLQDILRPTPCTFCRSRVERARLGARRRDGAYVCARCADGAEYGARCARPVRSGASRRCGDGG